MLTSLILSGTLFIGAAPAAPAKSQTAQIENAVLEGHAETLTKIRSKLAAKVATPEPAPSAQRRRYLIGYVGWRLSHLIRGDKAKEEMREKILDEAAEALEQNVEAKPDDAESRALLASVMGMQIEGSMFRAMSLGPKSSSHLERAEAVAPENPRVALLQGIKAMYTPSMFGGGVDKAQAKFDRAHELFEKQAADGPWPNWGLVDTYAWRGRLAAKRGDKAGARALYERALELKPNANWIRYELLPAVK